MTKTEDMPDHDPWGCSSASRWLACPGSVALSAKYEDHSSEYANEGTVAHEIVAEVLSGQRMPEYVEICNRCNSRHMSGACAKCGCPEYRLDRDMPVYCQMYVNYVLALKDANYVLHMAIEQRMQSTKWAEHGGTVDCYLIYTDAHRRTWCHVIDLKYGKGVAVSSDQNTQLKCYLNLIREKHPNLKYFRATIVQPRVGDGVPQTVEFSKEELVELDMEIFDARMREDELHAGPHCRWCRAAYDCPQVYDVAVQAAQDEFEDLTETIPDEQLYERWVRIMELTPVLRKLINNVPGLILDAMSKGHEFPGYKAVQRIGNREWTGDLDEVLNELMNRGVGYDDLFSRKLKSPAQIEKIGGKKVTEGLTFRPTRGYTVAPESDKRPAATLSNYEFDEIDESELEDSNG